MNIKQRVIIKIRQINIDNFSNQILLFILVIQIKMTMLKDLKLKHIMYQKAQSKIITSSMEKNFYDQELDSDIKWYKKIQKLITLL